MADILSWATFRRILVPALWTIAVVTMTRLLWPDPAALPWHLRIPAIAVYGAILLGCYHLCCERLDALGMWPSLAAIVIIALGLRAAWFGAVKNEQVSDFAIYQELAASLASGKGYAITGPVGVEDMEFSIGKGHSLPYTTAFRPPGAPLWGALLYKVFGPNPKVFLVSNIIFGAGTAALIFLLFELQGARLGRRAALAWSVYPSSVMATNLYGTEALSVFSLMLIAWTLTACPDRARAKMPLVGLLAAAAALIRSLLVPLIVSISAAIWMGAGMKRGMSRVAVFLAFAALGLMPWTVRNWSVFHRVIPVCTLEGMFLGQHTALNVPPDGQDAPWQEASYRRWRETSDEAERSARGYGIAADNLRRMLLGGPLHASLCLFFNVWSVFSDDQDILLWSIRRSFMSSRRSGPEFVMEGPSYQRWRCLLTAFHLLVVLGALAGALRLGTTRESHPPGLAFLAVFFLMTFAAHALTRGTHRYQFLVQPFMLILAARGYDGIRERRGLIRDAVRRLRPSWG
ncbi:MAG: glycosyltransferase family 39 protein [Elusimicrobia bacterium]|nr:glycosyltransferase family 39 protein [Elusimicrobiota bacterium]